MKKLVRIFSLLLIVAVAAASCFALAACNKNSNNSAKNIVGQWSLDKIDDYALEEYTSRNGNNLSPIDDLLSYSYVLNFNSDGTVVYPFNGITHTCYWEYDAKNNRWLISYTKDGLNDLSKCGIAWFGEDGSFYIEFCKFERWEKP